MIWLWLGCNTPPPLTGEPPPPAPVAQARIGGRPILKDPLVIGGIAEAQVRSGIEGKKPELAACWKAAKEPQLAGKVLLRFAIESRGTVSNVRTRATSLRRPDVESCLHEVVASIQFPALITGERAIITWPLTLPVSP